MTKRVLVPYAAAQMFDLVDDVESYPRFLPWCSGAHVLERTDAHKTARIDIDYHGVRAHFTTDNHIRAPQLIVITLKDGPFRHLHGEWRFSPLGDLGCSVELDLAYEFATTLLDRVIGPVFGHIGNTLIDAFVKRAETVDAAGPGAAS